jgi:hypothetical protein
MRKVLKIRSRDKSKGLFSFLFLLLFYTVSYSQNVGISATGNVPPNSSAGLDISATNKGLLIPRIALTATASSSPLAAHVAGMIVYNTATVGDVTPGFYYDNGTAWVSGFPKANAAGDMIYWDGSAWVNVPAGQPGQLLQVSSSGNPYWGAAGYASLTTAQVTGVQSISAISGGNITADGGFAVTARGVCWAGTANPTIADNFTVDGSGIGGFLSSVTGLVSGNTYYVRAYATNSAGTSYGNQVSFSTP